MSEESFSVSARRVGTELAVLFKEAGNNENRTVLLAMLIKALNQGGVSPRKLASIVGDLEGIADSDIQKFVEALESRFYPGDDSGHLPAFIKKGPGGS